MRATSRERLRTAASDSPRLGKLGRHGGDRQVTSEVVATATQFEFRLIDGPAPSGRLGIDDLLLIAQSLKEIATKISRTETGAAPVGRPGARTDALANLDIGLSSGSTRLLVRRTLPDGALDFDLEDEAHFDRTFDEIIGAMASGTRPSWASDSLADSVGSLHRGLDRAATTVEFSADGAVRATFRPADVDRRVWASKGKPTADTAITFIGRLRAVNLDTNRLQVTDDVGTRVALPNAPYGESLGDFLNKYVAVTGTPAYGADGRLASLHDVTIVAAPRLDVTAGVAEPVPLEAILATAPGPEPGGLPGLTDEEADAFLEAMGL